MNNFGQPENQRDYTGRALLTFEKDAVVVADDFIVGRYGSELSFTTRADGKTVFKVRADVVDLGVPAVITAQDYGAASIALVMLVAGFAHARWMWREHKQLRADMQRLQAALSVRGRP